MVLVFVASHRYKTVQSMFPKLRPRYYGPFKILKKNLVRSYILDLPPTWGTIHSTFYVSWLKKYIQGKDNIPNVSSYVPEIEDEHVVWFQKRFLMLVKKRLLIN